MLVNKSRRNQSIMTKDSEINELTKKMREVAFPGQTLCLIEFDNGESTNDFIPNEILADDSRSNSDWWNEYNQDTYLPLMRSELKAVRAAPIKEH